MKIRSLLLGSIAAAGLSTTGAFAADPVLTTLDLCDALGLTGITVSSDNNCLQISGEVKYEFVWGDYRGELPVVVTAGGYGAFNIPDNDAHAHRPPPGEHDQDWNSKVEAYFKVVGTADTDVGPAVAVIKMKDIWERRVRNENNLGPNDVPNSTFFVDGAGLNDGRGVDNLLGTGDDIMTSWGNDGVLGGGDDVIQVTRTVAMDDYYNTTGVAGDDTGGFVIDEAYVAIGGATVLSAGKKSSIMNLNDDAPFNWLGLFLSEKVDVGVKWYKDLIPDGGHVIQLVHDFGNGLTGGVGLENLNGVGEKAGTAVGVLAYAGEQITAHVTVAAAGVLDGTVEAWGGHAGITGTFNILKVRAALAGNTNAAGNTYWNALASAEATFDIFKIAWSGEAAQGTGAFNTNGTDYGVGASAGITVTDGVTINLGGRYYQDADGPDGWQVAGQVVAAITETLTLTGEVGVFGKHPGPLIPAPSASDTDIYGKVTLAWAPGGGFTSSIAGEVHQTGAYKATFKAGKVID